MSLQLQTTQKDEMLLTIEKTNFLVAEIKKTPHYQKLGEVGAFLIAQKCASLNFNVFSAINGGMFVSQAGIVELPSETMNYLIRKAGHSIQEDPRTNDEAYWLTGKRRDNGDTWTVCFSLEDARAAGLMGKASYKNYIKDMLYNKAMSRLAKRLFADVIEGCYVQGDITHDFSNSMNNVEIVEKPIISIKEQEMKCNKLEAEELQKLILQCPEDYQAKVFKFKSDSKFESWEDMPYKTYQTVLERVRTILEQEKKIVLKKVLKEMESQEEAINE